MAVVMTHIAQFIFIATKKQIHSAVDAVIILCLLMSICYF
jgi:hypothetical protein